MGSIHHACCECGFSADVIIGGGRDSFFEESSFPFYCVACGLVDVNVAKTDDELVNVNCPKCGKSDCIQYGIPPVSLVDLRAESSNSSRVASEEQVAAIRWRERSATEKGHICPDCKTMSLRFTGSYLLFD